MKLKDEYLEKDNIIDIFMKRLEKEKFFCEDIDREFFLKPMQYWL